MPRVLREELAKQLHIEPELITPAKTAAGRSCAGRRAISPGVGLALALCVLLLGRGRRTWQALLFAGVLPG